MAGGHAGTAGWGGTAIDGNLDANPLCEETELRGMVQRPDVAHRAYGYRRIGAQNSRDDAHFSSHFETETRDAETPDSGASGGCLRTYPF